jgi:hypothetical protein
MNVAGYLLQNATTNIEVAGIDSLFDIAENTASIAYIYDSQMVYLQMGLTAEELSENLFPYCVGTPTDLKYINHTAVAMFAILYTKIHNLTSLFNIGELNSPNGTDPMLLLEERSLVDSIINNCWDVRNYSAEISNFSPKFQ